MGEHPLPGYGSVAHGNRLVRTRMLGGVGAGGEIPPATRLKFSMLTPEFPKNIDIAYFHPLSTFASASSSNDFRYGLWRKAWGNSECSPLMTWASS